MQKTNIIGGTGAGEAAMVDDQHGLVVSVASCPPMIKQKNKVFRQYMTSDGTASGSNDLGIDGSSTTVKFWVPADNDNDRYITKVSFLVSYGGSAELFEFSDSGAALTNGFRFYYEKTGDGKIDIHDAIKSNADLFRLGMKDLLPTAWETRNVGQTGDYGYIINVSLSELIPPYGLKLDAGSSQMLVFEVRDDNTDADIINAMVFGFERFK